MAIQDVARAALEVFPQVAIHTPAGVYALPAVMVAIGGSETGGSWSGRAAGDPLSIYPDGGASERSHSCNGLTSFGWPQINLPANWDKVQSLSGIAPSDPCGQAQWLYDYVYAARAALAVYHSQGLGAWSTWGNAYTSYGPGYGPYRGYLPKAQAAIAAAAAGSAPSPSPSPAPSPTPQPGAPAMSTGVNPWIAGAGVAALLLVGGLPGFLLARREH